MKNIMRNTWLICKRNKDFLFTITIQPVLVFLLMSFLLAYSTTHKIAIINLDTGSIGSQVYDRISQIEGIDWIRISEEETASRILSGKIEMAVMIGENNTDKFEETGMTDIQLITLGGSEVENMVKLAINQTIAEIADSRIRQTPNISFLANEVKEKGITVSYSLSIMILRIVAAGSLLASLMINERNNKMKDRIVISGIRTSTYLGGMSLIYTLCMMMGSVAYYVVGLLFHFDFGMRNSLGFLFMLFTANVLSVALYLFASTLVKKDGSLWFMGTFVLMPMGLLSGVLFPFHLMPETMQKIANCLPFRWIIGGVEKIQQSGRISSALPNMGLVLGLSVLLYLLALMGTRIGGKAS